MAQGKLKRRRIRASLNNMTIEEKIVRHPMYKELVTSKKEEAIYNMKRELRNLNTVINNGKTL